jgi:glycosyltransferase involved in cell wall biosynthesis
MPLAAELISGPEGPVEVGRGTVVYVEGTCERAAEDLEIELAGARASVTAAGMSAPGRLGSGDRWWGLLELPAGTSSGESELVLDARLNGGRARARLASLRVCEQDRSLAPPAPSIAPGTSEAPLIAICMATYEPRADYLRTQIESIRAQDWPNWVCVISDDGSSAESHAGLREVIGDDERFIISRSPENLGFYRNFERAIRMAPPEARFITLADQDDRWDPDKLTRMHDVLARHPDSLLAYSDMRIATDDGEVISDTYWFIRRNSYEDMGSLLIANTVTGAASLFRAELLDIALPFPKTVGVPYHDHWLALCALALGDLAYLDSPTYDHIRHAESVTVQARGAWPAERRRGRRRRRRKLGTRWRFAVQRIRRRAFRPGWRAVYFERYLHLCQFARVLQLRAGERLTPQKRRPLRLMIDAERSPRGMLWLAARSLRPYIGWNETMARERVLLGGMLWRRLISWRAGLDRGSARRQTS